MDATTFQSPEFLRAGRRRHPPADQGDSSAKGFNEVLLPGEPELNSKAERLANGIPVAEATWNAIVEAGRGVGTKRSNRGETGYAPHRGQEGTTGYRNSWSQLSTGP